MTAPWIVIGAGFTGAVVVERLRAGGAEVVATRRAAGPGLIAVDLARPETLAGVVPTGAIVVVTAPPGVPPGAGEVALVAASVAAGARRIVYVSSTGVYGPGGGAWVDEGWPIAPLTGSGRARAAAEQALAAAADAAGLPWVALRAAGIYGPGRGLAARLRAGGYRVIGDGRAHVSRIHVEDLATAVIAAGEGVATGPINVADDDPAPAGEVADEAAAILGLPPPPRVDAALAGPEVAGMLTADRRISNRRMKDALGVALRFPGWRDGLRAELVRATAT